MSTNIYLSLVPEALVVSMLGPQEFGTYLATGTRKRAKDLDEQHHDWWRSAGLC